jgi:phenylalanyl-tRNA synthetase beta chain
MKISEQWLREWINPQQDTKALASMLTMGGLEIDQIAPVAGEFSGVIVAEVVETKRHPEADKLTLCQVNMGGPELIQVVCGAENVRAGLKVALATIGANLPNGLEIKATRLRGEPSNGMLCSGQELGMMEKSEGILELEADAPVGMDIRAYFKFEDSIFDIELTPNRGDCLSIQGVARELSAKLGLPINRPEVQMVQEQSAPPFSVEVHAPEACPLYTGRLLSQIDPKATTPLWMKERLRRSGIRPIHLVVDVTQYVMLELGQPLHAFNALSIEGGIQVRKSHDKEQLTLLDGQTITLDAALVIADAKGPLALAGIMGGKDSAVEEGMTSVFLESAFFAPQDMAGTARRHGLMTDASYRYERGVDPQLPKRALDRATSLLQQLSGAVASEMVSVQQHAHWFSKKVVQFRPSQLKKRLGLEIPMDRMQQILEGLGFLVNLKDKENWQLEIPAYRFDVSIEEDVIEELIRVEGYDKVPAAETITALRVGHCHPLERVEMQISQMLRGLGYKEVVNYSFVDPRLQKLLFPEQPNYNLLNPISPELSQMRMSLWPGLLAAMLYNLNRQQETIALFECGRIFDASSSPLQERPMVAGLLTGLKNTLNWGQSSSGFDFYDLKGDLESLFKGFSVKPVEFAPKTHEALHPGQTAALILNEQQIGWCGVLHPQLAQALDLIHDVILFECDLNAFTQAQRSIYQPISKYPKIRRDLAFIVDETVSFADIEREIRQAVNVDMLKSIHVFDLYVGDAIPQGKKSLAIALFIQREDKTLNDEEIQSFLRAIINTLEQKLPMTLRDGS